MPPTPINRRRFLGCSAAAGIALAQGKALGEASSTVRLGVIGLGNRGTNLVRALLEIPGCEIRALADAEPRHLARASGIIEKAKAGRPETLETADRLLERDDLDAAVIALPCDLHAEVYAKALQAGKHLYGEKPLALTDTECDSVIAALQKAPGLVARIGFQRRWNPRYAAGVELLRSGRLGEPLEARASWVSSNGPMNGHDGWLASRKRSGDWMVEQASHIWDLACWLMGEPPIEAYGTGRRDLFRALQPDRDVTDHYTAILKWPSGFHLSLVHSWIDPADDAFTGVHQRVIASRGGLDFSTGAVTYKDRSIRRETLHPGVIPDTRLALLAFVEAIRSGEPEEASLERLREAKLATQVGLMVRRAVDEQRVSAWDEFARNAAV